MRYALHTAAIVLAALATACGSASDPTAPSEATVTASPVLKTLQVASSTVECTGVGPQTCLQVRESSAAAWTLLYDPIAGFDYEPGFLYEIRIREDAVPNPPADASSVRRTLVSVLSKTAAPPSLVGPTWRLASIDGRPALAGTRVTALFTNDDRVAGSAGCNRYFGRAAAADARIDVGLLATTMMHCGADGVMPQEQAFLAAMQKAKAYRIAGTELHLGPTAASASLVFKLE